MSVLNDRYMPAGFRFTLVMAERVVNASWCVAKVYIYEACEVIAFLAESYSNTKRTLA